ncbi:hypothetical protein [Clostridium ihumii]|uniref:hypothetical protein n=1 Tax=Clostridium ihumii TaxID=1470356 RepID=UPI000557FA83|nr:hypothetical protein [Clostridium ihumii]
MSCDRIARRYNISELELLVELLGKVVEKNESQKQKCSSILTDNVHTMKKILEKFIQYKDKLNRQIEECKDNINSDDFMDWLNHDNELYLQAVIGIELTLEEYFVLYFYLDSAILDKNPSLNNKIILFKDELARKIAFTASWKHLCKCMHK